MSDILTMVIDTLKENVVKANEVADKVSAATTDRSKRVHELRTDEATDDTKVKEFQAWFEAANAKIEEQVSAIDEYIKGKYLTEVADIDVDALKEQYKELKGQVAAARKFAETVPGFSEDALKDVPEMRSLRGGTSGAGGGGKRPRIERISFATKADGPYTEIFTKVTKDGEEVEKTNFTLAAQRLSKESKTKVETKDLQSAAFAAAGTDDLSSLDGKVFDFTISVGETNYWLRVQPVDKSAAESEDEATEVAEDETVEETVAV